MTESVQSADGTTIVYERSGSGPALLLVGGAFNNRHSADQLVPLLTSDFTVYAYDRRGRGDSGDTAPYAVARELEDIAALIEAAGGSAMVYGHSSGAVLALEAAASGVPITKLAVYEPPYMDEDRRPAPDYAQRVQAAADAGDMELVIRTFLTEAVGVPIEVVGMIKQSPDWTGMLGVAHTIPYDNAIVGDGSLPTSRIATITVPTLAIAGGASEEWARNAVAAVAAAVPGAELHTIEGQDHAVAGDLLAPVLIDFFTD